jgi:hypothetical protein
MIYKPLKNVCIYNGGSWLVVIFEKNVVYENKNLTCTKNWLKHVYIMHNNLIYKSNNGGVCLCG